MWYMKDDKFERPVAYFKARIYTSDCDLGKIPKGSVFADLWKKVVDEYVQEFAYKGD